MLFRGAKRLILRRSVRKYSPGMNAEVVTCNGVTVDLNGMLFSPMHFWRGRLTEEEMMDVIAYVRDPGPFHAHL